MANIFEADNEYRIVDEDQLYLNSPYYVEIVEPVNYKDAQIIIERNGRGGFDFEYGSDDTVLEFGGSSLGLSNGKAEVMGIFTAGGTDANVKFQHYRDSTLIFEAYLIGSSEGLSDESVSYRIKRYDLGNKFKTRFSTPIDVEASEDLDGNAITPLTLRDMSLHSLTQEFIADRSGTPRSHDELDPSEDYLFNFSWLKDDMLSTTYGYWIPDVSISNKGDINGFREYGNVICGSQAQDVNDPLVIKFDDTPEVSKLFFIKFEELRGTLDVDFDIDFDIEWNDNTSVSSITATGTIQGIITVEYPNGAVKSSNSFGSYVEGYTEANDGDTDNVAISGSVNGIEVDKGDNVYVYVRFLVIGTTTGGSGIGVSIRVTDINSMSLVITSQSQENPTNCKGGYYNELLDKLLEYATGESGMLESTLFTNRPVDSAANACAGLNFITNGFKIRQRNQNLIMSISDLISFAETRYGCGYAIYYNSGNPKFLIEEQSFFFQDKKIMDVTPNNPVFRKINKGILFNEMIVGFKKYAKPNESGTSEGFSTQTEYLTPIEKDQNKATYLSEVIGDGTEIERVRRNGIQNADDESDEKDDDLFVVKVSEFNESDQYSCSTYGSGDALNIQRSSGGIIYVNGLIILGLSTNDYINLDGYTNRQIDGGVTLDYENNRTILSCSAESNDDTIYPDFNFRESDNSTVRRTYNPERLEGFNTVTGLIDKNSVYNLDHANSQFLLHNFAWYGGGLTKKSGSSEVRFLRKKNITILSKKYDSATCGKTTATISEDQNFTLTNLRSYDSVIFTEYLYEIKTNLSYAELVTLKEALRNESASDINYGYIEFDDNDGNAVEAFPMKIEYNPLSQECEIIAWGKNG